MNNKSHLKLDDEIVDKIISFAYNDLPFKERGKIISLIEKNELANNIYNEYKNTADSVHKLEPEIFPAASQKSVINKIKIKNIQSTFLADLLSMVIYKPLVTAGATAAIIIAILISMIFKTHNTYNYSQTELELANKQVIVSLGMVSEILNKTQKTLENDILTKKVGQPFNKGINTINDLFGGKNNEN